MLYTIPNLLTLGRIASVPLIVLLLISGEAIYVWLAMLVFIAAAISDFLDGYLARLWHQQTLIGQILDPIADKILVTTALLVLVWLERIGGSLIWAVILIINRELIVSGLRAMLPDSSNELAVTFLAKCKTVTQMTAISLLIIGDALFWPASQLGGALLWIAAILSLYSGYGYWCQVIKSCLNANNA